jgi:hypothetical protein
VCGGEILLDDANRQNAEGLAPGNRFPRVLRKFESVNEWHLRLKAGVVKWYEACPISSSMCLDLPE